MARREVFDCDACSAKGIGSNPRITLYENGVRLEYDLCTTCKAAMFDFTVTHTSPDQDTEITSAIRRRREKQGEYNPT